MESIFLKIPDLGEKILKELDNQSLVQSKEVQRSWNNFINEEKVLWIRIIQKCISDVDTYSNAWRKVLKKAPVEFVTHLALATQKYHAKYEMPVQYSPISVAASYGSLDFYKQTLVKLAGMNQKNTFGNVHPLFLAADSGHFEICKFIIDNTDDKNPASHNGVTPLFMAAQNGNYEICKLIIANVGEKNPARSDGVTPLLIAAKNGHHEICKLIIANVDDKNPAMPDGNTPLSIAAQNGHYEICKLIIANVGDKNPARYDGVTPLYIAAENGHYEICKVIITNVNDKNPARNDGVTSIVHSCTKWSL